MDMKKKEAPRRFRATIAYDCAFAFIFLFGFRPSFGEESATKERQIFQNAKFQEEIFKKRRVKKVTSLLLFLTLASAVAVFLFNFSLCFLEYDSLIIVLSSPNHLLIL